ncbi:hypothetical protein [Rhabdochromatium marinum]|uniref:hypothetical protein n=1 Tax=Rhabdochromatium marinum TaxID=48729 RepID=UPI001904E3E9|nr:hypothetical protein [Rhabdochromatium marinum]MBK1649308.1 hypothetical protein [Rhabdochromatium marinum]
MTTATNAAAAADKRHVLMRAMIWAIIGVIYAPLYIALEALFRLASLGAWSFVPAAALAGGAGAMLYSARQVAIAASLIGVTTGSILLLIPGVDQKLWLSALAGLLAGLAGGFVARFPRLCTSHVLAKALAGISTGALCGAVLALAEPVVPLVQLDAAAVAFLVSVSGVLYNTILPFWIKIFFRIDDVPRRWKQAPVIGIVAMLTAASVWIVYKSISGNVSEPMAVALMGVPDRLPMALMAGALSGAITGALLEVFRFPWALDV